MKMIMQKNSVLTDAQLRYTADGRSGTVHYRSRKSSFDMWYEFAGGNALAIIGIPTIQQWESHTKLPLAYREEVLQFIAEQVIRDQVFNGGYFEIDQNTITIYSGQKPVNA